jgi:hypothetical protein
MRALNITLRIVFLMAFLLADFGCRSKENTAQSAKRPFVCWQTMTSYAREALRHAGSHPVNSLILEFEPNPDQPGREWNTFLDDLAFDDSVPKVAKQGQARQNVEKLRANIRQIIEEAGARHIDIYLMGTEFSLPPGMLQAYPEAADTNSAFLWKFLESRLEEILHALPGAAGIVLYTDESSDLILYELRQVDRRAVLKRLLETYHEVCRRNSRRLIVSTFVNYDRERMDILLSGLREIPASDFLLVDNYVCPGDWGLIELVNPAIGAVGDHPEFLTFDYTGEIWGQANMPLCQARVFRDRIQAAQQRGAKLVGINGYVSWYTQSIFGTPSAVNLDIAPQLFDNPKQEPEALVRDWLRRRYGEAATANLAPAFLNSFEVATKSIQTLGFWVSEAPKSVFPDPVWIDFSLRTESLAVWDASYQNLENDLVHPNAAVISRVIAEKDAAVALASGAVEAVERSKAVLSAADYEPLQRQFLLQLYVARAYRLYTELYFRFRMWDQSGRGKVPQEVTALRTALRNLTAEMEARFAGSPVFCPRSLKLSLDRLDSFLEGEAFPQYAASLVQSHTIAYPPANWGVCPSGH